MLTLFRKPPKPNKVTHTRIEVAGFVPGFDSSIGPVPEIKRSQVADYLRGRGFDVLVDYSCIVPDRPAFILGQSKVNDSRWSRVAKALDLLRSADLHETARVTISARYGGRVISAGMDYRADNSSHIDFLTIVEASERPTPVFTREVLSGNGVRLEITRRHYEI